MIIAIDIGGTNTRIAKIDAQAKKIVDKISFKTEQDFILELKNISKNIREVFGQEDIEKIAIGIPGTQNTDGLLLSSPNLPQWENMHIRKAFETAFLDSSCLIANDASMAALGEAVYGAGKESISATFITVSTGIGGAHIYDKKIEKAFSGFEPGRQIIDYKNMMTLEDLASGRAVTKEKNVPPHDVVDEAYWKEKAKILAIGIWNTIVHWSPEVVIFDGPMILKNPGIRLEDVKTELQSINNKQLLLPQLVYATLKDDAGLYGAMAMLVPDAE